MGCCELLQALSPAVMMAGMFLARLETPTKRLVLSVLLIALGTFVTSIGEMNFSFLGVVIVVLSLVTDTSRLVMTQHLLSGLKFHPGECRRLCRPLGWCVLCALCTLVRGVRATAGV
jgi:drug/metabolite transporter (DMT)-like permease